MAHHGDGGRIFGLGVWWEVQAGTASGYPTYTSGVLDLSAYAGIQFDISGNAGPLGALTFSVISANQQAPSAAAPNCGSCDSEAGICNLVGNVTVGSLTSTATTIQVRWDDFKTVGAALDPAQVTGIVWSFPWVLGGIPYPVDVTIDNVELIPAASDASIE